MWVCYHSIRGTTGRTYLLLAASYVFYMWWRVDYALLLLLSTTVDYFAGLLIGRTSRRGVRRLALGSSLVVNLGLLVAFKYWDFFAGELVSLGRLMDPAFEIPVLDAVLPLGISFFTFQTMSYTIEVFRGKVAPERSPVRFALYVSFFPQLVAGPIERPGRLLPQIRSPKCVDPSDLTSGLRLMMWGMFKKVVVADRLAIYVDLVYGDPSTHTSAQLLLATAFFAVQIYCDFSGYTDIAIGCARTLGFDLMKNFSRPYLAWSPTEFWRRWHISLSTWFRDYVYIPLGGSRKGPARNVACLLVTFLVSGLWHGANWTFVVWGAVHGLFVLAERLICRVFGFSGGAGRPSLPGRAAGTLVTLPCVVLAWVFFRANSIDDSLVVLTGFFSSFTLEGISCGLYANHLLLSLALVAVVVGYDICEEWKVTGDTRSVWDVLPTPVRWCGYWSLATCALLLGQLTGPREFIYFQF